MFLLRTPDGVPRRPREVGRQRIWIGCAHCKANLCLYYKDEDVNIAVLGIYVDDLLATASSSHMMDDLFTSLKALDVQDLGVVRKFLGMRVKFKSDGFTLDQETLTRAYFEAKSMTKANPVSNRPSCIKTPKAMSSSMPLK